MRERLTDNDRLHEVNKKDDQHYSIPNEYWCGDCLREEIKHEVRHVPHGHTDRYSCWGSGIPTTRMECSACGRWNGPWVSSDIVGGGW